ncbi:MAG: flagellar filament capping protein FliD [Pseudomonadota bacterium]
MASITSSGIGSGLDINSLVSQLVAAERAPQDARLTRVDAKLTTEFTALSQLKGAMSLFQTALSGLKTASALTARKATVSNDVHFSATASGTATAGVYDVEVVQLAKAAQLTSAPSLAGPTTVLGTGALTLSLGGAAFAVTIDSSNNTMAGIRDAINGAADNTGVRATVITGVDGSRLILTGEKTGEANVIKVTQAGGDGALAQLVYDLPNPSGLTPIAGVAAQDAILNIAGFPVHSATNSIDGAIDGITLTLKKEEVGVTTTLTVANDDTVVQGKIGEFVNAYNALAKQIATLRSFDASTGKGGPLLGDSMLRNIETQLRRIVTSQVPELTSAYNTLSSVGIAFGADGTLALNATKFESAMKTSSAAVSQLFASTKGVANQLYDFLDTQLSSAGTLVDRNKGIDARRKDLVTQQAALNVRMATFQARYQKQFSALDRMLSQMQATSTYLTQQLAQSTNIAKSAGS